MATLTYVYVDSTAVLGPLAARNEPHGYDLCQQHAQNLSAPRGWEVIRLEVSADQEPNVDDLLALADAVREVGLLLRPAGGRRSEPSRRRASSGPASSSSVAGVISPSWPIRTPDPPTSPTTPRISGQ